MKQKVKNPAVIKRKRQEWVRIGMQVVFFVLAPSVYASAFAGVKAVFAAFGQGQPLEISGFVTQLLVVVAFTVLFGRFFCGWACAFGALGDWVFRFSQWVQKKCHRKLPRLPEKMVECLQWLKYLVLFAVLLLCFLGKSDVVSQNSPWTVFSLVISGRFALAGYTVGCVLLVLLLVGMAIQERFFCQFLCPMGAVFSLLPVIPFFQLKRKEAACPRGCGACKKNCPVSLQMAENTIREGECIRCGRCSGICPRGNITTAHGMLKGNELWADVAKGIVLLLLVLLL